MQPEVPSAEVKRICSGDFFFYLTFPRLNKPWWKELLLRLSMDGFPGMLDAVSGMYRFNEPIWKLTEMKREHSGRITHRITYLNGGREAEEVPEWARHTADPVPPTSLQSSGCTH